MVVAVVAVGAVVNVVIVLVVVACPPPLDVFCGPSLISCPAEHVPVQPPEPVPDGHAQAD